MRKIVWCVLGVLLACGIGSHSLCAIEQEGLPEYGGVIIDDVNVEATGYDWMNYAIHQKRKLMAVLFELCDVDPNIYSIEKGIILFDDQYYYAQKLIQNSPNVTEEDVFSILCIEVFNTILADTDSRWGMEALLFEESDIR